MNRRPPVEVLSGSAPDAVRGIEGDFEMLARLDVAVSVRVWTCPEMAVVLGVGRDVASEIDDAACNSRGVAVLRRASGGGTVVIGPGTLQYAIALSHAACAVAPSIDDVKRFSSAIVIEALSGVHAIDCDASGDLRLGMRKVGGVALRRNRDATLLHGTLLLGAALEEIAALLRHPQREPAWRRGRPHLDFLANLGPVDQGSFLQSLGRASARWDSKHR